MDEFSYLSVLLSIILGLAITQVLKGLRGLILARHQVQHYWPSVLWAIFILLICVQSWWAMFGMRAMKVWGFLDFLVVLAQTIVTYLIAALVFPDFGQQTVDLRAHYFNHARWFFGLIVGVLLISILKEWMLAGSWPAPANLLFHLLFMALALIAAFARSPWLHKALPLASLAVLAFYIAFLYARLA